MNRFAALMLMATTLLGENAIRLPARSVAEVASVMMDGDLCARIETPRSRSYADKHDPRDPWRGSDNFDVNDENFIRAKKTLMRLARLCGTRCDVNLWTPLGTDLSRVQVLIRNVNEMSQFWPWGALNQAMPPEMRRVLETGEIVEVRRRPGMLSALAPVRNSLGDIVGLVEVVTQDRVDPRENVK
jgi:hypothetical protein